MMKPNPTLLLRMGNRLSGHKLRSIITSSELKTGGLPQMFKSLVNKKNRPDDGF